MGKW
jgi:small subunit ribosomal protein S21